MKHHVEHTVLDFCVSVLMTLYLAEMWQQLSHFKYWSLCQLQFTPVESVLSGICVINSRKGISPSGLVSPTVNLIALSMKLMSCRNLSLCVAYCMTKVLPTILFQSLGEYSAVLSVFFQTFNI